jgi:hypothetical protein
VALDTKNRFDLLFRQPEVIPENILRKLGSILMNLMTIPDCISDEEIDGVCAGTKFGAALNFILLI